jgi:DNA polymerase I-like protein with 3'-5' exonuclease and polymerase domains
MKPSRGCKIVDSDYRALEVAINASYSNDKSLLKYLNDPSTDMHRDTAADCYLLKQDQVTKGIRQGVKGGMVFASFYGSYFKQTAPDLWELADVEKLADGTVLKEHLRKKGIKTYKQFEALIEEAERILWKERFPEHDAWRKEQHKFYKEHGYVELHTGFRCYGPMSRNNSFNTPPQGSGYHVLQWTMNKVSKKIDKYCERSYLIGEIHDAMILNVHPSEEDWIAKWIYEYGTVKVREHWPWITAPLQIEWSESAIDGSWAEMGNEHYLTGGN